MSVEVDNLFRLPARSVEALLEEFLSLRTRVRTGEKLDLPQLTLLLDSGHTLRGEFIDYLAAERSYGGQVLIRNTGSGTGLDVTGVSPGSIRALTVHHTAQTIHLLSFGKVRKPGGRVVGRLELERGLRSFSEELAQRTGRAMAITLAWDEFPHDEGSLLALAALVEELQQVLNDIAREALGAEALGQVERIELRTAQGAEVRLQDSVLAITAKILDGNLEFLEGSSLREAVERLL